MAAIYPLAVNVDGDLSDEAWAASGVAFRKVVANDGREDGSFEFALLSDGQSLFVGVRIFDGDSTETMRGPPECRDALEIMLGPSEADRLLGAGPCTSEGLLGCEDGRFVIDLANPTRTITYPETDVNVWHLRSTSSRKTDVGMDVELAFDLLLPRPVIVQEGAAFAFDIGFFDRDSTDVCYGSHVRWVSTAISATAALNEQGEQQRAAQEDPQDWGEVTFCGPPDRLVTPPGLGRLTINEAPEISLIEPAANAVVFAGRPFLLAADALDPDGEVLRVEFRILDANGDVVGRSSPDFRAPFGAVWTGANLSPGPYAVLASARDTEGAVAYADPTPFWVEDGASDPRPKWRIGVVGDEMTASSWRRDSFRRTLWQSLTRAGFEVDFLGGETRGLDGYLPPNPDFDLDYESLPSNVMAADLRREVGRTPLGARRSVSPHVAVLVVGNQDLEAGITRNELASDLRSVIETLRLINPAIAVFVAELPPNERIPTSITRATNAAIRAMAEDLNSESAPVSSVDLYTGYFVGLHSIDGIVPNTSGEAILASRWRDALEAFLTARLPPPVVEIQHPSSETIEVRLSHEAPLAEIRYARTSTDGTTQRAIYSEPLSIGKQDGIVQLSVWATASGVGVNGASSATVTTTLEVLSDRSPPTIVEAIAYREDRVLLRFDEPISEESKSDATRFFIDGLAVRGVQPTASDSTRVTLIPAVPLTSGTPHAVQAVGVEDLADPANATTLESDGARIVVGLRPVGEGLLGRYFSDLGARDFIAQRVDGPIDMHWTESAEDASVFEGCEPVGRAREPCEDIFVIQWKGYLRPRSDGQLSLSANVHGHFAMKVDGALVLDTKDQTIGHFESQPFDVRADTLVQVEAEYGWHARRAPWSSLGGGRIKLAWRYEDEEIEAIPAPYLYTPGIP
ncbi:MAG: hypothetical protein IPK13_07715 [Deltaproteobacteria bacterium]|nr:hypothetical protein [Deltaproteobacteria bacterium]